MFRVYDRPSDREINRQLNALRKLVREVEKLPPPIRIEGQGFVTFPRPPYLTEPPRRKDYASILSRREFWAHALACSVIGSALVGIVLSLVKL